MYICRFQQSSSIIGQKKFDPARDPCSVLWDVLWDNLMTMELTHGKKDLPDSLPSRVILYLKTKSLDPKDQVRIIKCNCNSNQALKVYTSIEQATNTYGPNQSKVGVVILCVHYSLLHIALSPPTRIQHIRLIYPKNTLRLMLLSVMTFSDDKHVCTMQFFDYTWG